MVKQILTGAGFVEDKTFKECRFMTPPKETYAVYNDSYVRRGSDDRNLITEHSFTIEVYSYSPDPDAEKRIERVFDDLGLDYSKEERYWIQEQQLYQVIYYFDFIEK